MTKGFRFPGCGARERGRRPHLRGSGEENLDVVEIAPNVNDQTHPDPTRTGGRLHGRDLRTAHRQARCLHHDARSRCAEPDDGAAYALSRRDADGHDHRPEGHHDGRQARFQIVDVVASIKPLTKMSRQICQRQAASRRRARRLPRRHGGAARTRSSRIARGHRRRGRRSAALVPSHPVEIPVAHRAALDRAAEMILRPSGR